MASGQQDLRLLWTRRPSADVLNDVRRLCSMHSRGHLGGAFMPEDSNPGYPRESSENYHYFTLPMALNYQRNSYKLWESAKRTAEDEETRMVFEPHSVAGLTAAEVRSALLKYKLALQPTKHTDTWQRICCAIDELLGGSIVNLFRLCDYDVPTLQKYIQDNKSRFPYLCGHKIGNYWLYVIGSYTNATLRRREKLSVAPDTHVIQASVRIGLVRPDEVTGPGAGPLVSDAWRRLLDGSGIAPIDIHTPLWLWSRGGFPRIV